MLKPVSLFRTKAFRTPVNQLHHMTNRTNKATRHGLTPSRQPIPDSAIRCRQRRQQYSEPHVHISCVCAPGTSVPRGHTRHSDTHRYLLPLCHPDAPEREFVHPAACACVIRNVETFKQAVQYQTYPNQLIFLIFLVPQHGGRDVM